MKKLFSFLIPILVIPAIFFTSCNKSDNLQQILDKHNQDISAEEAARNHGCCPCCPATVPEAQSISYGITNFGEPLHVGVAIDVFYINPDAPGTFRVVLRKANGLFDSVSIVPAQVTPPGQTAVFHLEYDLPEDAFPCTLHVNGRPDNLECDGRSRKSFPVTNEVSKP